MVMAVAHPVARTHVSCCITLPPPASLTSTSCHSCNPQFVGQQHTEVQACHELSPMQDVTGMVAINQKTCRWVWSHGQLFRMSASKQGQSAPNSPGVRRVQHSHKRCGVAFGLQGSLYPFRVDDRHSAQQLHSDARHLNMHPACCGMHLMLSPQPLELLQLDLTHPVNQCQPAACVPVHLC
jgi:hypothetical protein